MILVLNYAHALSFPPSIVVPGVVVLLGLGLWLVLHVEVAVGIQLCARHTRGHGTGLEPRTEA